MAAFSVTMQNQTIVADATLVIIHAEATSNTVGAQLNILRAWVSQMGTATSQQLGVILGRKVTAFGTYTSTTPTPLALGGPASAITGGTAGAESTAGTDASAEGGGTVNPAIYEGFNNLNGWLWVPTPEERLIVTADQAVILKIVGTPTTLTGWNAGIVFEEVL